MVRRSLTVSLVLAMVAILYFMSAHPVHATFCLGADQIKAMGASITGMTPMTMVENGQEFKMYCNMDPRSSAPPPGIGQVCSIYCPPPSTRSSTGCSCTNPAEPTVACQPGERRATAADVPLMKQANISNAVVGMCWKPNDPNVGQAAAEAKQYLRSIVCAGSKFGGTTPDGTVQGLDSKFAVCAAKFLKAMSSQLPGRVALYNGGSNPVCLREGYRTKEQQMIYYQEHLRGGGLACGSRGVERCEHPRGIAIDVNTAGEANYRQMWSFGPQYGVNFYLRDRDKVHFVPSKGECTGGGSFKPGDTVPPSNFDFPQHYNGPQGSSQTSPISPIASLLGSLFNPSPMPYQPIPMQNQTPQYSQTPPSHSPSPTTPINPPQYTPPPPPQQPATTSTQQQTSSATTSNASGSVNINSNNNIDNVANTINEIAAQTSPHDTVVVTTSSPAQLNENLKNLGTIADAAQATLAKANTASQQNQLTAPANPYGTATFAPAPNDGSSYNPQQLSAFASILGSLKEGLMRLAQILQPFRGQYYIR